jgi:hypothetical protein
LSFSFAVETRPPRLSGSRWRAGDGKGKPLSSKAAIKSIILTLFDITNQIIKARKGLRILAFRRPRPVECEAYSSGVSEKLKNNHLCALCVSAVKQGHFDSVLWRIFMPPYYKKWLKSMQKYPKISIV